MKIKEKLDQHRRDFTAIYVCEFCGAEEEGPGYDDAYFHEEVIPHRKCKACGKASGKVTSSPDIPAYVVI